MSPVEIVRSADALERAFSLPGLTVGRATQVVKGDFPRFVEQIGWTLGPCGGCDKLCSGCPGTLKRWTPVGNVSRFHPCPFAHQHMCVFFRVVLSSVLGDYADTHAPLSLPGWK